MSTRLVLIANEVAQLEKLAGKPSYKEYVKKKKKKGEKPLSKELWESRVLGKGKKEKAETSGASFESTSTWSETALHTAPFAGGDGRASWNPESSNIAIYTYAGDDSPDITVTGINSKKDADAVLQWAEKHSGKSLKDFSKEKPPKGKLHVKGVS